MIVSMWSYRRLMTHWTRVIKLNRLIHLVKFKCLTSLQKSAWKIISHPMFKINCKISKRNTMKLQLLKFKLISTRVDGNFSPLQKKNILSMVCNNWNHSILMYFIIFWIQLNNYQHGSFNILNLIFWNSALFSCNKQNYCTSDVCVRERMIVWQRCRFCFILISCVNIV